VRLIAATNKNIEELVKAGSFRKTCSSGCACGNRLPPLRDRAGDIPLLAQNFLREFARENTRR